MAIRRGIRVYLYVFSAGIFLFCVSFARGHHRPSGFWGRSAHSVVAYLAWEMMDEALRAHLEKLWPDKDFAQVSFEADLLKRQPGFRHTASWHYGTFKDEDKFSGVSQGRYHSDAYAFSRGFTDAELL